MLRDRRVAQERWAEAARRKRRTASELGDWFLRFGTPSWLMSITFQGKHQPGPNRALKLVKKYLRELGLEGGYAIGWIMAADRGSLGGRLHFHILIFGVGHLNRTKWWKIAFRRFGRARIVPYDNSLPGARYVAENALSDNGDLHFGGKLLDEFFGKSNALPQPSRRRRGRPRVHVDVQEVVRLREVERCSWSEISGRLHLGGGTVRRAYASYSASRNVGRPATNRRRAYDGE
jgi:hypothetical protein